MFPNYVKPINVQHTTFYQAPKKRQADYSLSLSLSLSLSSAKRFAALLIIAFFVILPIKAEFVTVGKISYGINTTSKVAYVDGSDTDIVSALIQSSVTVSGRDYPVTSIASNAFSWCTSLTSVTIPTSVTKISSSAFAGCTALQSVYIHNYVTSIGSHAFDGCTSLSYAYIGSAVTSIGDYAFNNCAILSALTIGTAITAIGKYAFYGCRSISALNLPATLKTIGAQAFYGCTGLSSITVNATTPPTLTISDDQPMFSDSTLSNASLYVPKGYTKTYKAATGWSAFARIVDIGTSAVDDVTIDHNISRQDIYTIHGVLILKDADNEAINNLAPGIYIIGKKKVLKQ
jgi:hypothetical protein